MANPEKRRPVGSLSRSCVAALATAGNGMIGGTRRILCNFSEVVEQMWTEILARIISVKDLAGYRF